MSALTPRGDVINSIWVVLDPTASRGVHETTVNLSDQDLDWVPDVQEEYRLLNIRYGVVTLQADDKEVYRLDYGSFRNLFVEKAWEYSQVNVGDTVCAPKRDPLTVIGICEGSNQTIVTLENKATEEVWSTTHEVVVHRVTRGCWKLVVRGDES